MSTSLATFLLELGQLHHSTRAAGGMAKFKEPAQPKVTEESWAFRRFAEWQIAAKENE